MATRSTIAYQYPDGSVSMIYCHWDGYLDNNGKILFDHYRDESKIQKLCGRGHLSSLGQEIDGNPDEENSKNGEYCVFFPASVDGTTDATKFNSFKEYLSDAQKQQYNYIYRNGSWAVEFHETRGEFVDLEEAMAEQLYQETVEDDA